MSDEVETVTVWRERLTKSIAESEQAAGAEFTVDQPSDRWSITAASSIDWPADSELMTCTVNRAALARRCVERGVLIAENEIRNSRADADEARRNLTERLARAMFRGYLACVSAWVAHADFAARELACAVAMDAELLPADAPATRRNRSRAWMKRWLADQAEQFVKSQLAAMRGLSGRRPITALRPDERAARDAERTFLWSAFREREERYKAQRVITTKGAILDEMALDAEAEKLPRRADGRRWTRHTIEHAMRPDAPKPSRRKRLR